MKDFLENWLSLGTSRYKFKLFLYATVFWVLWKSRNKMRIEGVFVRNPAELIFEYYHAYRNGALLRAADQKTPEEQKTQVTAWVESFVKRPREPVEDFLGYRF